MACETGVGLTSTGADLLANARSMTEAADRVSLAAAGHAELKTSRRVRRVYDFLAETIKT